MTAAIDPVAMLLGKVFSMLSVAPVAAYVDSLELGHNSEQIKAKLLHTQGLLQIAQGRDVRGVSALKELLVELSINVDQAEDLLDEVHYFQIHDRLHGTTYATTQPKFLRHGRNALRHTVSSVAPWFSSSSSSEKLRFQPVTISRKIKSVLQDMHTLCDSVSNLLGNIPGSSMAVTAIRRPKIGSTIKQDTLYGRRDTFEKTVSRIINCNQTVSVLPIVGPGGIGKTTFTQHLYNDARAEKHFEVKVWVCVSTDFDVPKLTREILGCIPATKEEGSRSVANETTNLDQLQKSIANRLKSKSFLIVLDDIWKCNSEDEWKTLLAPFTKGETKGSVVLVTTRFPKVAALVKTVDPVEMRGLDASDFFTFFEACICGDNKLEKYEDDLAGIAREIANKLKGSPLAAKTVGRLLQKDFSHEHWNRVLNKHEWLNQEKDDDIMPSLQISYDYLPFDLKKCFSYFGLYPEDHQFDNSEMNHLFVAVGIADLTQQVDRNYLEELVDNGFLMKEVGYHGPYYVLHDLMHELCRSVSAREFLCISDIDFRADVIPQSVRHLSITIEERYGTNFEEEMCKLSGRIDIASLRTLMISGRYGEEITRLLKDCFKEIKSLRVLFIGVDSPESYPHRFSKLIHLRYVKISSPIWVDTMCLPSTISRFYHLKFLDLHDWEGSSDLPKDFSHLENLHDFGAKSELHSNIRNIGKIKHLRRLKEFRVKKERMGFELRELGALTELEELIIHGLEHVATKEEAAAAKLMLKRNLKELKLLWDRDRPTIDADILDALQPHPSLRVLTIANPGNTIGPRWLCPDICLTSLETLTLEGISWSTLPPFGKLPNLKVLNLKRICGMRQFGPHCGGAPGKCFMRLKAVGFHEMPELAEWVVEPNRCSFPSLEVVKCVKCPNLRVMPFSETSCTNLCKLKVSGCPKMSLPSMPHTSTLTDLVVKEPDSDDDLESDSEGYLGILTYGDGEMLTYDGKELVVRGYGGALAFHNLDKVEAMTIEDASHISWTDLEKLKVLKELSVRRWSVFFPEVLDDSIVFLSVQHLQLDVSHVTRNSLSKVLNCFPTLSMLEIGSHPDPDYGECVMQFPLSSSMQKLRFTNCEGLVLVPLENGGGIQEDNSSLLSLKIYFCGKFFSRWPMGEAGGGPQTIYPLPHSLRKLHVIGETGMKSMALLSNLMSLTILRLANCSNLTVDGFNPLITVNLRKLEVTGCNTVAVDLLSEVARTKLLPTGCMSRLEYLHVDDISELLVAPICNLLAPALHTLIFYRDKRAESFTEEQEKALQLLTSLQKLSFVCCEGLQSLPQGLHRLSSLKELVVLSCLKIESLPKEGFPVSLRILRIHNRNPEIDEQIEKIKRTNPDFSVSRGH